jgi:hypothetical protein
VFHPLRTNLLVSDRICEFARVSSLLHATWGMALYDGDRTSIRVSVFLFPVIVLCSTRWLNVAVVGTRDMLWLHSLTTICIGNMRDTGASSESSLRRKESCDGRSVT